jgi:hypothetical protein
MRPKWPGKDIVYMPLWKSPGAAFLEMLEAVKLRVMFKIK